MAFNTYKEGDSIGSLVIESIEPATKPGGKRQFLCRCSCGRRIRVSAGNASKAVSCGHEKWEPFDIAPEKASYLAAIVDGEGCVTFSTHSKKTGRFVPIISIGMTDEWFIRHLHATWFGIGSVHVRSASSRRWKPCTVWQIGSNNLRRLIPTIEEFVVLKKQQIQILRTYLELSQHVCRKDSEQLRQYLLQVEPLFHRIRQLNSRGSEGSV